MPPFRNVGNKNVKCFIQTPLSTPKDPCSPLHTHAPLPGPYSLRVRLLLQLANRVIGSPSSVVTPEAERGSHNDARHATPNTRATPTPMSSNSTLVTDTPAEGDTATPALKIDAQEAFPGLPQDVVVTHILRSDTDPIVLARLHAVSRAMRDTVDSTGLLVEEMMVGRAAELGYLDTLKHKREKDRISDFCDWFHVCRAAARGGHLEVLQWACANGCPWDVWTCRYVTCYGHLEVLQWARANGAPWDAATCAYAAKEGHLEVLQWLRANGCPWNKMTCRWATEGGHLEVLQWLRANRCPWSKWTRLEATRRGWRVD